MTTTEEARTPGLTFEELQRAHAAGIRACNWRLLSQPVSMEILENYLPAAVAAIRPAPSSPGVPDSVRALSEAADYAGERYTESVDDDSLSDQEYYRLRTQARQARRRLEEASANFVRTLISAHPAGQSTGQGAGLDMPLAEDVQFPGVKFGKGVTLRTVIESARRRLSEADAAVLAKLPASASDSLRPDWHRAMFPDEPAPDSTRTGKVGTEEGRMIGPKMTPEQEERIAHNLCGEFGPEAVAANAAFAKAFYDELYAAARPAAPEAQGAPIVCDVLTMRLSDGRADYFTRVKCADRDMTIFKFGERYKAQYHADEFAWLLGLRPDKPDLMAYDEASHPNVPAPYSGQEG